MSQKAMEIVIKALVRMGVTKANAVSISRELAYDISELVESEEGLDAIGETVERYGLSRKLVPYLLTA